MSSHTCLIASSRGLEQLIAQANTFISRARAASTVRAYRSDWNDFTSWCNTHHLQFPPSTPETIALYITDLASRPLAVATIVRRLTAIAKAHATAGQISPASTRNIVVGDTLRGIKRTLGTAQHKKEALAELQRTPQGFWQHPDKLLTRSNLSIGWSRTCSVPRYTDTAFSRSHRQYLGAAG